jgi:WhiB family redox-sensing transcriptional regulator
MTVVLPHHRDQGWREEANCIGVDLEIFFPDIPTNRSSLEAKVLCRACPVSLECLEEALAQPEEFGIFGGLSPYERQGLRSKERNRREQGLCRQGHPMTPDNIVQTDNGQTCRTCRKFSQKKYDLKRNENRAKARPRHEGGKR